MTGQAACRVKMVDWNVDAVQDGGRYDRDKHRSELDARSGVRAAAIINTVAIVQ